ncbi:hypothetical protein, partial [Streptomyces sp. ADI93-02]|uniref:hypothetical protein n=1 Tax=Streptomyces sp. ADI93-02 TaxID=1522757 RepID=UPI0019CFF285
GLIQTKDPSPIAAAVAGAEIRKRFENSWCESAPGIRASIRPNRHGVAEVGFELRVLPIGDRVESFAIRAETVDGCSSTLSALPAP